MRSRDCPHAVKPHRRSGKVARARRQGGALERLEVTKQLAKEPETHREEEAVYRRSIEIDTLKKRLGLKPKQPSEALTQIKGG